MPDNDHDLNRKTSGIPTDSYDQLQILGSHIDLLEGRLDHFPPTIKLRFTERFDALKREWDVTRHLWDELYMTDESALDDVIYGLKLSLRALELGYHRLVQELDEADPDHLADS